jgi:3-oxoacyl-[acyl-carrier-protein] synthase III
VPVFLHGPRYELGEEEVDHTGIAGLDERIAQFGLAPNPRMWGWGTFRRTTRSLEQLAIASGAATLRAAGMEPSSIDALILCSTRIPGPSEGHGRFLETVITGLGLGDIPYYGQTLNRCVNLLAALDLASAFVAAGRYRRILCVTTDRVADEADRMAGFAMFCDGAASCVVAADEHGPDAYRLLACATAQDTAQLDGAHEISSDLAREVNDRLLTPQGMKLGDVEALLHLNLFIPLVVMKERQAGFSAEQLYLENISRTGHCFAADPLINLADRAAAGQVHADGYYLLAASVPGSRIGVLLQRKGG